MLLFICLFLPLVLLQQFYFWDQTCYIFSVYYPQKNPFWGLNSVIFCRKTLGILNFPNNLLNFPLPTPTVITVNNSLAELSLLFASSVRLWCSGVSPGAGFPGFHRMGPLSWHSLQKAKQCSSRPAQHTAHVAISNTYFLIPCVQSDPGGPSPDRKDKGRATQQE